MSNYKAIQMHMIDNGFSMERRRDNWNTIKYRIRESIEKFIYDLTKRRPMIIPVLENL